MKEDGKCRKKNKDGTEALCCMLERKLKGLYFHDASIRCKPLGVKKQRIVEAYVLASAALCDGSS